MVYKAYANGIIEKNKNSIVAVKTGIKTSMDPTLMSVLMSELKIMIYVGKHLNVINLLGACTKNIHQSKYLIFIVVINSLLLINDLISSGIIYHCGVLSLR